jgi:Family of unknown function (DUF6230)
MVPACRSARGRLHRGNPREGHVGREQFGGEVSNASGPQPVVVSAINSAKLTDLCQSVKVGPVTLRLTAGTGGTPASASNLIVDASGQTGSVATFKNIGMLLAIVGGALAFAWVPADPESVAAESASRATDDAPRNETARARNRSPAFT